MSYEHSEQIFHYHGYALGIGGYVARRGERWAIAGLTPGALSISGGNNVVTQGYYSWAPTQTEAEPQNGGFRVSASDATSELWTEETATEWITHGIVTINQFNLCDRLRIGKIVSSLTSRHRKNTPDERARISFAGSSLQDVFLDGIRIDVDIDTPLDRIESYAQLRGLIGGTTSLPPDGVMDADACDRWTHNFCDRNLLKEAEGDADYITDHIRQSKASTRRMRCSIVSNLRADLPGYLKRRGYSISVEQNGARPEFGRIFFGEIVVADGMKRLNMVRWNLGCDNCSDGTAGTVDLNGDSMP